MELQNQPTNSNLQLIVEPAKKCKHMPIIIILAILAIGGFGFGGYELWQNMQKDNEVKNLQAENTKVEELKEEKENEIAEENKEIKDNPVSSDIVSGPYIKDSYFYVPDWGLKFKIPEELDNYGYSVDYDKAHVGYTLPEIGFTAMLKSDTEQNPQAAYYDNIATCAIVSVSKEQGIWDTKYQINGIIQQFDDYALLIWNHTAHGSCDYGLHIDDVQKKIQTMFQNPEDI